MGLPKILKTVKGQRNHFTNYHIVGGEIANHHRILENFQKSLERADNEGRADCQAPGHVDTLVLAELSLP